jgi:benzoate membrane transport protein
VGKLCPQLIKKFFVQFFKDLSPSTLTAGFVAVLVGFTSSVAIVFQAAQAFGASSELIASWMWALSLGMGLCTLVPSLWLKKPVMVAWSTPGAAVLAVAGVAGGFSMHDAVGAFIMCGLLITLLGMSGGFERFMNLIPFALAQALLAGVLTRFALSGFAAAQTAMPLVAAMLLAYLIGKRFLPRYAVLLSLAVAITAMLMQGTFQMPALAWELTRPVYVSPAFSVTAFVSLALPLFVVTMASQNMPGVAAIRQAGFDDQRAQGGDAGIPISKVITLTGAATLVLAPFGAFALNLSAITAAICMGPQAHANPARRYTATATCGAIYIIIAMLGSLITGLLNAFPKELIAAIAGIALLGTIAAAISSALQDDDHREAALITFLVTLSGVVFAGLGSAVWGVLAGALAYGVQRLARKSPQAP